MKGLKKVALASAIAAISAGAQADLKALDDSTMGEMTGQAGLTIDVSTKWSLGEFMYKDGGSVVVQNIQLGGNTIENAAFANGGYLDNYRLYLDVAGAGNSTTGGDAYLNFGMSNVIGLSGLHVLAGGTDVDTLRNSSAVLQGILAPTDPVFVARGAPVDMDRVNAAGEALYVDQQRTFGNGDLVIKSTFTDPWQKGGGFDAYANRTGDAFWLEGGAVGGGTTGLNNFGYTESNSIVSKSVDFFFGFEVLGLASSTYSAGDAASGVALNQASSRGMGRIIHKTDHATGFDPDTTTTTLISDLSINGYFGPSEFIIRNKGNGFGNNNATYNYGDAMSKIETSRYFAITDLDVYIDIAGVSIKNLQIHNRRGDLSGLYEVVDAVNGGLETTTSYGFAHGTRDIWAVKDSVIDTGRGLAILAGGAANITTAAGRAAISGYYATAHDNTTAGRALNYTDGIVLHNKFKGDIDIPHLSFGNDGRSIGEIYMTDYTNETKLTISAH